MHSQSGGDDGGAQALDADREDEMGPMGVARKCRHGMHEIDTHDAPSLSAASPKWSSLFISHEAGMDNRGQNAE
jgi:hypothetical protein